VSASTIAKDKVKRRTIDSRIARGLHDEPLAGRVLAGRGLQSADEVILKNSLLPAPSQMADFENAVGLLANS